jgi:hypothetical protein
MNLYIIPIIILIILILYSLCYFIYPTSIIILQTTLNEFNFNQLLQKQPLVIGDKIADVNTLLESWFGPNIINIYNPYQYIWNMNNYKYMFIYSQEDTEILLLQAGKKLINNNPDNKDTILAIKLYKNQSLIIPFKWHFYYDKQNIKIYGIHDYITYMINIFTKY